MFTFFYHCLIDNTNKYYIFYHFNYLLGNFGGAPSPGYSDGEMFRHVLYEVAGDEIGMGLELMVISLWKCKFFSLAFFLHCKGGAAMPLLNH